MNYIPGFAENASVWSAAAVGLGILLGVAAVQDCRTREVTNGIWLLVMLFWMPFALGAPASGSLAEPIIFWGLQEIFFCRFYGRADCHAFSCCGFYLWGMGQGLEACLVHMLVALLLMGAVQGMKGNVNIRGNLRMPVPFLPYILLGFCGILVWIFL